MYFWSSELLMLHFFYKIADTYFIEYIKYAMFPNLKSLFENP